MKKKRQSKVVGVELRAGGGLHGPEKPGRSAGNMVKQPENQMKIQQQNQKHRQIKIQQTKTKTSPEVLPSKVTSLGVFDF